MLKESLLDGSESTAVSEPMTEDRRARERFRIECPVAVQSQEFKGHMPAIRGKLVDIASNGARLLIGESLEVGSHVVLEVELPSPRRGLNRIRFEGTVLRSQSQHEVAVTFPESGRFLRLDVDEFDRQRVEASEEE
jgi:PilZ domain